MKAESLLCPNCKSPLPVSPGDTSVKCEYCGSTIAIDNDETTVRVNISEQEEAGYQFEKGRQRAQAELQASKQAKIVEDNARTKKTNNLILWILGWIFVFPVPLTILMMRPPRAKNIDMKIRIGIIAAGWIIYLLIAFFGGSGSGTHNTKNVNTNSNGAAIEQTTSTNANT